jgi:uncharacterized membrane protein YjjP (DUF1212 family)
MALQRREEHTVTTGSADVRIEFLSAMARALSRHGETAGDIEQGLGDCARSLGLPAEFYATPTAVLASFGELLHGRTVLMRTDEGSIDLHGMSMVREVLDAVTEGEKTPAQGLAELRLIETAPPRFTWPVRVAASAVGAASFAALLGGGWREFLVALPVGLVVGVLVVLGGRYARLTRLTELVAGFAAAVMTMLIGHLLQHFSLPTVTLAGVILLLPGLGVTMGVAELASRHLAAGTARLAGATVTLVNLSVGSFLGFTLFQRLDAVPRTGLVAPESSVALVVVSALALAAALFVMTNSRPRDAGLVLAAVALALAGARFGAWLFGATLGVAVASLGVGLASNAYARRSGRPAALALIPGLAVLVPGSLGLRGVADFLRTAEGGMDVFTSVLIIAAGLVVGLAVADATLPPRRPPRD